MPTQGETRPSVPTEAGLQNSDMEGTLTQDMAPAPLSCAMGPFMHV